MSGLTGHEAKLPGDERMWALRFAAQVLCMPWFAYAKVDIGAEYLLL